MKYEVAKITGVDNVTKKLETTEVLNNESYMYCSRQIDDNGNDNIQYAETQRCTYTIALTKEPTLAEQLVY